MGMYAAASVAAVVFSMDPRVSLGELAGVLTLGLVPMTVTLLDGRWWDRVLAALTGIAVVSSAVGLWQYLHGASHLENRLHGLANHYMTFSGWTLLVALLLVGDVLFGRDRRRLLWTLPSLVLCVAVLVLSLTRGVWVGLAAGLIVAAAVRKPVLLVLCAVAIVLLVVAGPRPVQGRLASIFDVDDPSNHERLCMAEAGLEMVRDQPFFGVGLGMVKPSYERYRASDAARERVPHLHCNPIQLAAERGLVGLTAYLAILAVFFAHTWSALRRAPGSQQPALAGCLVAVAGITVAGLFEYNWGDAEVWIPTLVCLSAPFALAPRTTP
jgi:O-antigen ligase